VKGGKRNRGTWCLECYNFCRQFRPRHNIEKMKDLARSRGGLCLSEEYINSKSKLLWQCDKGHCWHAVPVAVRGGSWCPVCARNRKLTLEEFRSLAARKGGRCLSDRYTNKSTPLRWQCVLGHRWYAQPGRVRRGAWCAKCATCAEGVGGDPVTTAPSCVCAAIEFLRHSSLSKELIRIGLEKLASTPKKHRDERSRVFLSRSRTRVCPGR
jgi:hypothetical protein